MDLRRTVTLLIADCKVEREDDVVSKPPRAAVR